MGCLSRQTRSVEERGNWACISTLFWGSRQGWHGSSCSSQALLGGGGAAWVESHQEHYTWNVAVCGRPPGRGKYTVPLYMRSSADHYLLPPGNLSELWAKDLAGWKPGARAGYLEACGSCGEKLSALLTSWLASSLLLPFLMKYYLHMVMHRTVHLLHVDPHIASTRLRHIF